MSCSITEWGCITDPASDDERSRRHLKSSRETICVTEREEATPWRQKPGYALPFFAITQSHYYRAPTL